MAAAGGERTAAADSLLSWCQEQLVQKFGLEVNEELIQYILSIESSEEIEEYVSDLVQGTDGKKQLFIDELLKRWKRSREVPTPGQGQLYRKKDEVPDSSKVSEQLKKSKRKGRNKQEPWLVSETQAPAEEVKTPIDLVKVQEANASTKKKTTKYTSLYTTEGQDRLTVILPGRHGCDCLAQKHKLINNCLNCGRIVCEQEGSGPCMFCGILVCTREEQEILVRDSNKSQRLRKKLMATSAGNSDSFERDLLPHQETLLKTGLEKAIKHKDKLLEYDKTSARRTQVIDDESDYFTSDTNQWLSKQEREALRLRDEELRDLRHASRQTRKITIDFAGRQVLESEDHLDQYYNRLDEFVHEIKTGAQNSHLSNQEERAQRQHKLGELVNPDIVQPPPLWVEQTGTGSARRGLGCRLSSADNDGGSERSRLRIQDRELLEISDSGMCLSMHQPWASLLITGIKRAEGRTWYTSHRGRLWIAAAAKKPSSQEIAEIEQSYKAMYGKGVLFPKDYPTGCLLGCVDLLDCVSQEQYREQFTDQESGSPFVFICANPQELLVKFPMKGKHKIWKLDTKIHQGMKKGLMRQKQSST